MPVTLRKRPAKEPPAAAPAPPAKKKGTVAKAVAKVKETVKKPEPKAAKGKAKSEPAAPTAPAEPPAPKVNGAKKAPTKVAVGDIIDLEGFGGEIETNDGKKTTLKKLVDENSYTSITVTGYSIYGLSKDSPKSNTKFKTDNALPYPLLCDTSSTLITAIGLKKAPSSTVRGVFVIDKSGKILAAEPGSPAGTLQVVEKLVSGAAAEPVAETEATEEPKPEEPKPEATTEEKIEEKTDDKPEEAAAPETNGTNGVSKEDAAVAEVAADVADTAEKLDSNEEKPAEA
ncbi:TSA family protein [Rutstroemia sp. NJR-2017a BBW]|nr:TSA family protein [Rutstroemia sp. NJR-2017a BBW]